MLLEKAKSIVAPSPAFVQVSELATATARANSVAADQAAARLQKARVSPIDPLNAARDRLNDLAKLISTGATKDEQAKCADAVKSNELLQAWKQDELARLGAEEKALHERKAALEKFDADGKTAEQKLQKELHERKA